MAETGLTGATFRCDACGEPAAVVELVTKISPHPDDDKANPQSEDRCGVVASVFTRDFLTMFGLQMSYYKNVLPASTMPSRGRLPSVTLELCTASTPTRTAR